MSMDEDIGGGDEEDFLAAEYVLGLLEGPARDQFGARLRTDQALQRKLQFWRLRLAGLDVEFAEVSAPAGVIERVEQRLFGASPAARTGWWNSLALWRSVAAACVVIAGLGVGFGLWAPHAPITGPELAAALEAQGSDVKFVAIYNQSAGTVQIAALSGTAVPEKDFELWAIKGSNKPESMGVIPVNTSMSIPMTPAMAQGFGAGTVLAVTLEQKGGSPTGVAQGPLVAKGVATPI